jgi:hypothetical protein
MQDGFQIACTYSQPVNGVQLPGPGLPAYCDSTCCHSTLSQNVQMPEPNGNSVTSDGALTPERFTHVNRACATNTALSLSYGLHAGGPAVLQWLRQPSVLHSCGRTRHNKLIQPACSNLLLLLLYWIRALPDRPVGSQTRLIGKLTPQWLHITAHHPLRELRRVATVPQVWVCHCRCPPAALPLPRPTAAG